LPWLTHTAWKRNIHTIAHSSLSQINRVAAKGGSITIDDETASLLDFAQTCYQQNDGLFDITSGQVWKFGSHHALPD